MPESATFFPSQAAFRDWLKENHNKSRDVWLGFYKKDSGRTGVTYLEALDEALCYGWIDTKLKRIDATSHMIRFVPRRSNSIWSPRNIQRVKELTDLGLMKPSGLEAFRNRDESKTELYSYAARIRRLDESYEERFKAHKSAWRFFQAQPSSYRRTASFWIMSAKLEETRVRRLKALIEESKHARRLDWMAKYRLKKNGQ